MPFLDKGDQLLLVAFVNLVDEQKHGYGHLPYLVEEVLIFLGVFHHIGDVEQDIGIGEGTLREGQHHLLHLVVGFQHTRGVGKDDLHVFRVDDAHDAVTRGLSFKGGYADAFAYQLIHQCGLAHIGVAYNIYKSCLVLHLKSYFAAKITIFTRYCLVCRKECS